jgi:hypothetical protein
MAGYVDNPVDNPWKTSGRPVDALWTSVDNFSTVHIPLDPSTVRPHVAVHRKGAATWENDVFHSIHSPYYYDLPITR